MGRSRLTVGLLVFATALAVAGVAPATTGLAEHAVKATSRFEGSPAAARTKKGDALIWSESRVRNAQATDAYLKVGSKRRLKLNRTGRGFTGGIDPPRIVYQQIVGSDSNIKVYRLDKGKRVATPRGINTKHWEHSPSISGKWILFGRQLVGTNRKRLILFNRSTRRSRVIASLNRVTQDLHPGQLNGNWAVWTTCTRSGGCDAFVYNIGARATQKLPVPDSTYSNYGPAVTKSGVVYAGRSGHGCGLAARVFRYRRGDDPALGTEVAAFPDGVDFGYPFARAKADGSVDLYYERHRCGTKTYDVYRMTDPPPP